MFLTHRVATARESEKAILPGICTASTHHSTRSQSSCDGNKQHAMVHTESSSFLRTPSDDLAVMIKECPPPPPVHDLPRYVCRS